jgi:hypothetical protein
MKIWDFVLSHFVNYESANSLAFRLRQKRAVRIRNLIDLYWRNNGSVKIIDIGGSGVYWKIMPREFLRDRKVHITVLNLPSEGPLPEDNEIFSFVTDDGCDLSTYRDNEFDIAHSNSVIEHVGDEDRVKSFASESERVGKTCYLQTPNFWFPVEPHFLMPFFHWLPLVVRASLLTIFNLGQFSRVRSFDQAFELVSSIKLLTSRRLHQLFPEATFYREKFLFLTKSFMIIDRLP